VAIQYCPTKEMVADYFTKPLQGELFYKFRDQIMGVVPMKTIIGDHRSVLDNMSNTMSNPVVSDKRHGVSPKLRSVMRSSRAQDKSKATVHTTWADIVKAKPLGRLLRRPLTLSINCLAHSL
jgi:hypothetical protein